jgi:hypothetical protein
LKVALASLGQLDDAVGDQLGRRVCAVDKVQSESSAF